MLFSAGGLRTGSGTNAEEGRHMDENRRALLWQLGMQRGRVLECLGGNSRFPPGYFEPPAGADILSAFRAHIVQMSEQYAADATPIFISLLAAGRLLTGDVAAADVIVDRLPAEAYRLDHGAGICWVTPQYTLSAVLPLPANLNGTSGWLAGSDMQAALRTWLAGHRDRLRWFEIEGLYLPRATEGEAPPVLPPADAVMRARHMTGPGPMYRQDSSELMFVGDAPVIVVEWDAARRSPAVTIPLDPAFLHRIDWEDAQYVYERPVEFPRRPLPRRSIWQRLFG
jgi:hypothetical protein